MKLATVLTDLDGTLLEPDGTIAAEAVAALAELRRAGVPVCLVTSKTPAELEEILARLGLDTPAGFENGAGVRLPGGGLEHRPQAVPVARLAAVCERLRRSVAAPIRTFAELDDRELGALTGLRGDQLARARARVATLPLLVDERWDEALRSALPHRPRLRLQRGNRFLHLQGDHDKAGVAPRLLSLLGPRVGATVCCGDAANDGGLLAAADIGVIVPSGAGPHAELVRRFPAAIVAPRPHGPGWAVALRELLLREDAAASAASVVGR